MVIAAAISLKKPLIISRCCDRCICSYNDAEIGRAAGVFDADAPLGSLRISTPAIKVATSVNKAVLDTHFFQASASQVDCPPLGDSAPIELHPRGERKPLASELDFLHPHRGEHGLDLFARRDSISSGAEAPEVEEGTDRYVKAARRVVVDGQGFLIELDNEWGGDILPAGRKVLLDQSKSAFDFLLRRGKLFIGAAELNITDCIKKEEGVGVPFFPVAT